MQELRSTEILDNEIRAEARRKAENVLKRADEECAQILAGVDGAYVQYVRLAVYV